MRLVFHRGIFYREGLDHDYIWEDNELVCLNSVMSAGEHEHIRVLEIPETAEITDIVTIRLYQRPSWPKEGDLVNYHSIIGGEVTETNLEVFSDPHFAAGTWVVWLKGKAGYVAVEALSRPEIVNE